MLWDNLDLEGTVAVDMLRIALHMLSLEGSEVSWFMAREQQDLIENTRMGIRHQTLWNYQEGMSYHLKGGQDSYIELQWKSWFKKPLGINQRVEWNAQVDCQH